MKWYNYIACFFAGAFGSNFWPHFINGISGRQFPTPFASPPGQGLSSPMVNVLWALMNLAIALLLIYAGKLTISKRLALFVFLAGFALMSLMLSNAFAGIQAQ